MHVSKEIKEFASRYDTKFKQIVNAGDVDFDLDIFDVSHFIYSILKNSREQTAEDLGVLNIAKQSSPTIKIVKDWQYNLATLQREIINKHEDKEKFNRIDEIPFSGYNVADEGGSFEWNTVKSMNSVEDLITMYDFIGELVEEFLNTFHTWIVKSNAFDETNTDNIYIETFIYFPTYNQYVQISEYSDSYSSTTLSGSLIGPRADGIAGVEPRLITSKAWVKI